MATFKSYDPRVTTAGPGRLAKTDDVLLADPAHIESVMSPTAFTWALTPTPWLGLGATDGGINISKGFQQNELRHDLADSAVKTEITAHSVTVTTNLTDTGDSDTLIEAWNLEGTMTTIALGSTPATVAARKYGIGTFNAVGHKSLALVEIDEQNLLRIFYLRDVALNAQDAAIAIAPGAFHQVPVSYVAFTSSAASTGYEFGMIMEESGFGGLI